MARNDPIYRLVYFDVRGLAEPIRMIFAYSAVKYDDVRVKKEEWITLKGTAPYHTLPYLEVDGEQIGQSTAIARFLAKRFNIAGKGDVETAKMDAIVDYVIDARNGLRSWFEEADESKKSALKAKYMDEALPEYLQVLEQHLQNNQGGQGFFIGNNPTWCDFVVACFTHTIHSQKADAFDKTPLLKNHFQRVHELKGIKDWVFKRPKSAI